METQNAARHEVEIELKGKTYTIRELDLKAYGDMENHLRSQHIKAYREAAVGVDQALVEETVVKLVKASYSDEELAEGMSSPTSLEYVAYLALRDNPDVATTLGVNLVNGQKPSVSRPGHRPLAVFQCKNELRFVASAGGYGINISRPAKR